MKKGVIVLSALCLMLFSQCKSKTENTNTSNETTASQSGAPTAEEHAETTDGIHFHKGSWQEALAKAKSENKLIFLDIAASWCGPCKMLKQTTFVDKKSGDFYNSKFINVALDGEVGEGIELAKKYAIDSYPSLLFINAEGNIVGKGVGYMPTADFVKMGESVLAQKK